MTPQNLETIVGVVDAILRSGLPDHQKVTICRQILGAIYDTAADDTPSLPSPAPLLGDEISDRRKRNTRTRLITHNGQTRSVAEWARETEIPYPALLHRLNCGWPVEDALTTPINKRPGKMQ